MTTRTNKTPFNKCLVPANHGILTKGKAPGDPIKIISFVKRLRNIIYTKSS
jgi:hypothetical protein